MSEPEWPTWTANKGTSFIVDGLPLLEIFKRINKQLEILKDRPVYDPDKISPVAPIAPAPIMPVAAAPIQRELSEDFQRIRSQKVPSNDNSAVLIEQISELNERLTNIERSQLNINLRVLDEKNLATSRFETLETTLKTAVGEVSERLIDLSDKHEEESKMMNMKIAEMERQMEELQSRQQIAIDDMMADVKKFKEESERLTGVQREAIEDALQKNAKFTDRLDRFDEFVTEIKSDLHKFQHNLSFFGDQKAVMEQRFQTSEETLFRLSRRLEQLSQDVLDHQTSYENSFQQKLDLLNKTKATKEELEGRAAVSDVARKADVQELRRLEDVTAELSRRISFLNKENSDAMASLQKHCDKSVENVMQWCFGQLRHVAGQSQPNDEGGGADIGKVRCLVCDQVVKQHPDQEVVFGGPGMKSTIRVRKTSPPPNYSSSNANHQAANNHISKFTVSVKGAPDIGTASAPPGHPTSKKSKLASLSAHLVGSESSPLLTDELEEVAKRPEAEASDPGLETGITPNKQQEESSYFKDLEHRFAGTGGRRFVPDERPSSAPMKRVHTKAKLVSLSKQVEPVNPLLVVKSS